MNILVLNCGSSTLKFQLIATDLEAIAQNAERRLAPRSTALLRDTREAVDFIIRWVCSEQSGIAEVHAVADIHAVGHRVVHGGEHFKHSVLISDEVLRGIEDCIDLAPLHNPANIKGILAAREVFG